MEDVLPIADSDVQMCNLSHGMALCSILYDRLKVVGIFPALTGGLVYKEGDRKDIDIVLFRHRQKLEGFETNDDGLISVLTSCGLEITGYYGFVTKAKWKGFTVDLFNPETKYLLDDSEYGEAE